MPKKKFYEDIIKDKNVEQNFCSYMQAMMDEGSCVGLINDDFGHWAVVSDGIQNCPDSKSYNKEKKEWKPFDVSTSFFIEKKEFAKTIGKALQIYARRYLKEWTEEVKLKKD